MSLRHHIQSLKDPCHAARIAASGIACRQEPRRRRATSSGLVLYKLLVTTPPRQCIPIIAQGCLINYKLFLTSPIAKSPLGNHDGPPHEKPRGPGGRDPPPRPQKLSKEVSPGEASPGGTCDAIRFGFAAPGGYFLAKPTYDRFTSADVPERTRRNHGGHDGCAC